VCPGPAHSKHLTWGRFTGPAPGHYGVVTDDHVRDEAFELFAAEAARTRLADRAGNVRIVLRSGRVLVGELGTAEQVAGHLRLVDGRGRQLLVAVDAISTIRGSSTALRDEETAERSRSLASMLRETWALGERLQVLLHTGEWIGGAIRLVASDHLELVVGADDCVIPFAASEAWGLGPGR